MRFALALAFIFLFSGCGGGQDSGNNNHGYGDSFDAQGVSGLRLRFTPILTSDNPMARVSLYETEFAEVEQCAGLAAPAPFVIIVPVHSLPDNKAGFYLKDPSLILIDGASIFKHEAIHYLLDKATGDSDHDHRSPLFDLCSPASIEMLTH